MIVRSILPFAALFLAGCCEREPEAVAQAEAEAETEVAVAGEGWESLFDGKALAPNWEVTDYIASKGIAIKEGGIIELRPGEPLGGIRWIGEELPKVDFEVSLEARRVEGDDFFCCF